MESPIFGPPPVPTKNPPKVTDPSSNRTSRLLSKEGTTKGRQVKYIGSAQHPSMESNSPRWLTGLNGVGAKNVTAGQSHAGLRVMGLVKTRPPTMKRAPTSSLILQYGYFHQKMTIPHLWHHILLRQSLLQLLLPSLLYWIKSTSAIKAVPILGLCNSTIDLASSKLVLGLTLDWNMIFCSSIRAVIMVPLQTLVALVLWSLLLLGIKFIPKLLQSISVPSVHPPHTICKPYIPLQGIHEGSMLLALDASIANLHRPRVSRLRGKKHLHSKHRPSNEAPTVNQRRCKIN